MTIIGIAGDSGSGKTTVSENLFTNSFVVVYHLDHIFDSIKDLLLGILISKVTRSSGEVIKSLDHNKQASSFFSSGFISALKWLYARYYLGLLINKAQKDNVDYFIIEGFALEKCVKLDDLDYRIFVRAPQELRNNRVLNRNVEGELNCANLQCEYTEEGYDAIIDNDQTFDDLLAQIRFVEEDIKKRYMPRTLNNN